METITITEKQFNELNRVMDKCFNFILILEDMDIAQVNELQTTPKEDNISITSKELMEAFKNILNMDIE